MFPTYQEAPLSDDGDSESLEVPDPAIADSNESIGSRVSKNTDSQVPEVEAPSLALGDLRFYALFEAALDAMVIADDQGCYVAANSAACELFGLAREELLGRSIADFAPPGFDLEQSWQGFQSQGQERGEFSLVRADGTIREVEYAATANFIPHCHLSVLRDVTERKQLASQLHQLNRELERQVAERTAELQQANQELQAVNQQLQASEQKYQTLFEILPIGVSITDAEGKLLEANPASEAILGISLEEQTQRTYDAPTWQMIRSDGTPMPAEEYPSVRALQERRPILEVEQGIVHTDGTVRWIATSAAPIPLQPYGVAIAYIDITDRKQLELALQASEARLNDVLNGAGSSSIVSFRVFEDRTWEYEYQSPGCETLFGYTAEEILTDPTLWMSQVFAADRETILYPLFQEIFKGKTSTVEFRFHHKDGSIRWISATYTSRYDAAKHCWIVVGISTDISDRKAAELALQQSEARYRILTEISPVAIFRFDRPFNCVYVNDRWSEMTGRPKESALGQGWIEALHPDERDIFLSQWAQQYGKPDPTKFILNLREGRHLRPDGSITWYYVQVAEECDETGAVTGYVGTLTDITARKLAELALQESEERFREIASTIHQMFFVRALNPDRYLYLSPAYETIWGRSRDELFENPWIWVQTVYPDDLTHVQTFIADKMRTSQDNSFRLEYRIVRPDTEVRWVSAEISVIRDSIGNPLRFIGLVEDITERKQSEELLDQEILRRRALFNASMDGIVVLDQNHRVLEANTSFAQMLGYSRGEIIGLKVLDFDANWAQEELQQKIARNEICQNTFETRHRRKDGSIYDVEISSNRVEWNGKLVKLCICRDISDRKRNEAERKAAEIALSQREQQFRTLVENSPDAIMRCDRQYRFLYVNPTATELNGIPGERYFGKTFAELGFPEQFSKLWNQALEYVFTTGQKQSLEYEMLLPRGNCTFYSQIVPELTVDGVVTSVLAVARDITKLKQAQDALAHQSERERSLRLLTQHIRETLDLDDILTTAVTEVQRILQADRTLIFRLNSDHSGVVIQEAVRPEYPVTLSMCWQDECFPLDCYTSYCQGRVRVISDIVLDDWGHCLVEFMQQTGVQSKVVAPIIQSQKDGTVNLWGLLIVHACKERRIWHRDEADLLQQVADQLAIAIQQSEFYRQVQQLNISLEQQVQDRTTDLQQALGFEMLLKRITDQVRDSLEEDQILETVVRELGQGLRLECCDTGIYDPDLTTSTIAHEFTQAPTSAKGTQFVIAEASHAAIYPALFQGQVLQFCDSVPCDIRPDTNQLSILACPIIDDQRVLGDLWLYKREPFSSSEVRLVQQVANQCAIALRQSRLYQAAQAQVQELARLNRLKDDFLSTVSHELRTPMANIKMATQMLEISLNRLGILPDQSTAISRYFNVLRQEEQREINLINDLLDLTRLDAGSEALNLTEVVLQSYLPRLSESFLERIHQHQQQFLLQIPENLPPLTTDLSYLERILTELLQNACKYTPVGETITLSAQKDSTGYEIRLSNSGVEVPAAEQERIFDRFYRILNNDPWKYGGTGLGLALVKKMVEHLGGEIVVESSSGLTQFIIRFSAQ